MQLETLRRQYLEKLCRDILGLRGKFYSNADKKNNASVAIADAWATELNFPFCASVPTSQRLGKLFADHTLTFIRESFGLINHVRPGKWLFSTEQRLGIAAYEQYDHLGQIKQLAKKHRAIRLVMGGDYLVKPDIMIGREPVTDVLINSQALPATPVVSAASPGALLTPLRAANNSKPTLHASVSCKWTIRSDRAQNTRTEALNLIRNRKGRLPCIMVVTAEPLPLRLASIAIGTGDIDCAYHAGLPELQRAVAGIDAVLGVRYAAAQQDQLQDLVDSRRLRDILRLTI